MSEFLAVVAIGVLAAILTLLGALVAERVTVRPVFVSHALQFAGGILTGLVALTLMAPAFYAGPITELIVGFFAGGIAFVILDFYSAKWSTSREANSTATPLTLYIGILIDMIIDGIVIGLGSTLTLATGLALAISIAISTAPLALVSIATAKTQGKSVKFRRVLSLLFFAAILGGALLGFLVLRNVTLELRLLVIAIASGFLIMTVTQSIIPEANRNGEPGFAAASFIAGLSLYALFALVFTV
ncbi:MAG TPA: hypothetical protein VER79_04985 [Candidatus Limnocylindrales bacterium]|nr:hypothetical protein [Candidatus Limnocylindrales bacterium]